MDQRGRRYPSDRSQCDARERESSFLTGQLGHVMKESAQTRNQLHPFGGQGSMADRRRLLRETRSACPYSGGRGAEGRTVCRHHDGDGNHVGGNRKKKIRADLAMTGEITLRGRVLPIGGLKGETAGGQECANDRPYLIPAHNAGGRGRDFYPRFTERTGHTIPVTHMDEVLRRGICGYLFPEERRTQVRRWYTVQEEIVW